MKEYRDRTLEQLGEGDVGSVLRVAGWVENIRDHGGVSFLDLRDMYGVLQVVLRDTSLLEGIAREDCVSIEGLIEHRDEETYNPKIPTGTIELEAYHIDILGRVSHPLPFEIITSRETREDVRLKYRYLDLRNPKVRDNMIFRSKVIAFLRQKMTDMGFLEIQTPILCASSPEGARDYIVPSRKFKGQFYALPQAPQQYKQLLMVAGFDKYFQIAPCFRDEDARADRSPGEFYQLDFEMSFADQEDVFRVGEEVLTETFEKFAPEGSRVTQAPYPVISYRQAMLEFGTDKPDLRNPLRILDVTEFFQHCTFKPFQPKTVRASTVPADISKGFHEKLLRFATSIGMGGLGYLEVEDDMSYKGPIDKFIPAERKGEIAELAGLIPGDTIFFIADKEERAALFAGEIRNELGARLGLCEKNAYRFC
ncbi:MAG: aspartate--tRNA ligase, partial [Lachnospiraceae bacterium]|nr:aspartate--tRNA ligase [Lachnospiraceae bacterium]